jgi:chromosome segregation ATPase
MKNEKVNTEELQEKLNRLTKAKEELRAKFIREAKEKSGASQLEAMDQEIQTIRDEIKKVQHEAMASIRETILKQAEALAEEKKNLLKRIAEINKEGVALAEKFDLNIPSVRIQVSSKQSIHLERESETKELAGSKIVAYDLTGYPVESPIFEVKKTIQKILIDGIPQKIEHAKKMGWRVCEGERIIEEELTPMNSMNVSTLSVPAIFDIFFISPYMAMG